MFSTFKGILLPSFSSGEKSLKCPVLCCSDTGRADEYLMERTLISLPCQAAGPDPGAVDPGGQ